jgi:hypothetical protein
METSTTVYDFWFEQRKSCLERENEVKWRKKFGSFFEFAKPFPRVLRSLSIHEDSSRI